MSSDEKTLWLHHGSTRTCFPSALSDCSRNRKDFTARGLQRAWYFTLQSIVALFLQLVRQSPSLGVCTRRGEPPASHPVLRALRTWVRLPRWAPTALCWRGLQPRSRRRQFYHRAWRVPRQSPRPGRRLTDASGLGPWHFHTNLRTSPTSARTGLPRSLAGTALADLARTLAPSRSLPATHTQASVSRSLAGSVAWFSDRVGEGSGLLSIFYSVMFVK